ncbi:MAG: Arm DNA-binding domain-containing protein [Bacteroidota bacterium]
MATVKIVLRKSKTNAKGEAPLCIRITQYRRTNFIFTDSRIKPVHWDQKQCKVRKSHPNSTRLNAYLTKKLSDAQNNALELETKGEKILANQIKEKVVGKPALDFFKFADMHLAQLHSDNRIGSFYDPVTRTWGTESEYLFNGMPGSPSQSSSPGYNNIDINVLNLSLTPEGTTNLGMASSSSFRSKSDIENMLLDGSRIYFRNPVNNRDGSAGYNYYSILTQINRSGGECVDIWYNHDLSGITWQWFLP